MIPRFVGAAAVVMLSAVPPATAAAQPVERESAVTRVVDGDTIRVDGGEKVRLIGVDTPETHDPRRGVECFGRKAARFLRRLLPPGTAVRLATDVETHDRFGRSLAYVYRSRDGLFVNAELVRRGYASLLTVPPNVAHVDELRALQREAREAGRGLWSACPSTTGPVPVDRDGCVRSYVGVCVPPPPPDLDCADVGADAFEVVGPDPHHFDGNGDGVGCEGPPAG